MDYPVRVPLLIVTLVVLALLLPIVLLPVSIVQRYRVGTARRPARAWVATLNVLGFGLSAVIAVLASAITTLWVPHALAVVAASLGAGALLGVVGLWLSRWESTAGILYFTPNRWLVTALTTLVLVRLGYGAWRAWHAWAAAANDAGWLATAGVAGSLGAGALLIGYGVGFWGGVRLRIARRRENRLRYI